MVKEPTVEALLNRFREELQSALYPFLVVSIIERNGSASREEIRDEIAKLTDGTVAVAIPSHNRQVGRLSKTFRLIEPSGRENNPSLVRYRLTKKGKRLYAETLKRVVYPLGKILPIS